MLFIEDVVTCRFSMLHRMAHATYMWTALYGVSGLLKKKKVKLEGAVLKQIRGGTEGRKWSRYDYISLYICMKQSKIRKNFKK